MEKRTVTGEVRLKEKPQIIWVEKSVRTPGREFLKNMAVAASLMLCALALRGGAIPPLDQAADIAVTALTDESLLDEPLGRLSFVSALFPQATLVFGQSDEGIAMPVSSRGVVHAWSVAEPYTTWSAEHQEVYAACSGTVMGVYHGNGEERLIHVQVDDGRSCVYANLSGADVTVGDRVETGDLLGVLMENKACVFEIRVDGVSVDPAPYLNPVT